MPRYPDERMQEEAEECELLSKELKNNLYYLSMKLNSTETSNEHEVMLSHPILEEDLFLLNEVNNGEDLWRHISSRSYKKLIEEFKPLLLASVQDGLSQKLFFKDVELEIEDYKWGKVGDLLRLCVFDVAFVQFICLSSHEVLQIKFFIDFNLQQFRPNEIKFWLADCSCQKNGERCWMVEKKHRICPGRQFNTATVDSPSSKQKFVVDSKNKERFYAALKTHLEKHICVCDTCEETLDFYKRKNLSKFI